MSTLNLLKYQLVINCYPHFFISIYFLNFYPVILQRIIKHGICPTRNEICPSRMQSSTLQKKSLPYFSQKILYSYTLNQ